LLFCQQASLGILRGNDVFYFSTVRRKQPHSVLDHHTFECRWNGLVRLAAHHYIVLSSLLNSFMITFFFFFFPETGSHYVVQVGLEGAILLPEPPELWDYRLVPPHPVPQPYS
jgi:hypothetical protein